MRAFYDGHSNCFGEPDEDGLPGCGGEGECTHKEGWYLSKDDDSGWRGRLTGPFATEAEAIQIEEQE